MFCPQIAPGSTGNYIKRDREFRTKQFSFDVTTFDAYSFGWWKFVVRVGNTIYFNNSHYSNFTSNHQEMAQNILKKMRVEERGLKIVMVYYREGLNHLDKAIRNMRFEISELEKEIAKPRSWASTNEKRRARIERLEKRIAVTEKLAERIANRRRLTTNEEWVKEVETDWATKQKNIKIQRVIKRIAGDAYIPQAV